MPTIIPTRRAYISDKVSNARQTAVQHILNQKAPNVPIIPDQSITSRAAAYVLGMSDEERIRLFGTADVNTCIYTVTSQFNDEGALVSGNKTFRKDPIRYGFEEIPMDSVKVGDMIQFSRPKYRLGQPYDEPHHSVLVTNIDSVGNPLVSYSRGHSTPYVVNNGDTIRTMQVNKPISAFTDTGDIPAAFRYYGSPEKRAEWDMEYSKKFNINPLKFFNFPKPQITHTEEPDALRIDMSNVKSEGGKIEKKKKWDKLSIKEKADMMRVAIENGITTLSEIKKQYNEFAEGGDTEDSQQMSSWNI